MSVFHFSELKTAPYIVDAEYDWGEATNTAAEPIHVLVPGIGVSGGFRKKNRKDESKLPAYVVLYTSFAEPEWPDYIDTESGVFRYYGDNRHPGKDLHDTHAKGNALLRDVFSWLDNPQKRKDIPPFLIFSKEANRSVRFLGLAVPGNNNIPAGRDLIAFWRTMEGRRFQNYESYFTILDLKNDKISREWLKSLVDNHDNSEALAPKAWIEYIDKGRLGIRALKAPKITTIPSKESQLATTLEDQEVVNAVRLSYQDNPTDFEKCAARLVQMMEPNFYSFDLTPPWRDGGRDAIGKYHIGPPDHPLTIDCALEAKCYARDVSVGVRPMSRLISRIKYRQFGILVTTSFVDKQAYSEIIDDSHPILIITERDIARILKDNGISKNEIKKWISDIEQL